MASECVFIVNLQNVKSQPEDICHFIKKKFNEFLSLGYTTFKFIVVTDKELNEWIDYVRCIIEYNISATITIDQVNEMSEEVVRNAEKISDFLIIKHE